VKFPFAMLACFMLALPVSAATMDRETETFVESNLIAIYFHELGHALIDIMKLPIFGQEEDAADVLSVLLVDALYKEDRAVEIARAAALGFLRSHNQSTADGDDIDYWDVHGPDIQRFFTFVCLFYGADPDKRATYAKDLHLPEDRRETCPAEFQQAHESWGPVLKGLADKGAGRSIRFLADYRADQFGKLSIDVISAEVAAMNSDLSLPRRLLVRVESCDTANAFYDPKLSEIIVCTDFARYLAGLVSD